MFKDAYYLSSKFNAVNGNSYICRKASIHYYIAKAIMIYDDLSNVHCRIIIDGPDSGTVFNGHEPLFDELYTLTNHFVSGR